MGNLSPKTKQRIKSSTIKKLKKLKLNSRESYDDVINRLIKTYEE